MEVKKDKGNEPIEMSTRSIVLSISVVLALIIGAVIGLNYLFKPGTEERRNDIARTLYSRQDLDHRAAPVVHDVYDVLNHIEFPHTNSTKWNPTSFEALTSLLPDISAYGVRPEDMGYTWEEIAELGLIEAARTYPPHRLHVEWRECIPRLQQQLGDGGFRFWVDEPEKGSPEGYQNWVSHDLLVHLPKPQAEALIKKVFGRIYPLPKELAELATVAPQLQYPLRYQMFTGCNEQGQEVFIYGFSQKFPVGSNFWQHEPIPEIAFTTNFERTAVITTSN